MDAHIEKVGRLGMPRQKENAPVVEVRRVSVKKTPRSVPHEGGYWLFGLIVLVAWCVIVVMEVSK